jgi:para-aminobenzoate synthetase component 1
MRDTKARDDSGKAASSSRRRDAGFSRRFDVDAAALVGALVRLDPARRVAILDSCAADEGAGARFLIAGFDPFEVVEARGRELRVWSRDKDETHVEDGSVLDLLDERLKRHAATRDVAARLPASGACVAALSYELARAFESPHAFARPRAQTNEPDATLSFFDTLVIHDYANGETTIANAFGSEQRIAETHDELLKSAAGARESSGAEVSEFVGALSRVASNFTRADYEGAVARVREHVYAGDIYQANLTQQLTCRLGEGARPEDVFLRLRRDNPAPFAAFMRAGERTIVSASPERFLRVGPEGEADRVVEAWPIKGTMGRGETAEEDARLRAALLASTKDRAENVMIVDLLRNDLGRVCRFGSVHVAELCAVREHPTLFHLVSKVRGRLRDDVTAGALLRATFPCGSITGAPKIRAMRVIDEIETVPRGLSMGSIGYFSFDGRIDLSVAIRTATIGRDGAARFNVGGGVVADSDPPAEYEESLLKARALLDALDARF